jgi:(5-formylfuran-3-yl)methyl phosphate synthase
MQLLVSVANAEEADAALIGGAIIIDAKDPTAGALAPVPLDVFRAIQTVVGGIRPVSAALGDAADAAAIEAAARLFADAGAAFVKVGFAGVDSPARVRSLIAAAVRGTSGYASGLFGPVGAVAVAYADHSTEGMTPFDLVDAASSGGATGVLIDTADKQGPALPALMSTAALTSWVARAHEAGLTAAVAGKLTIDDLRWARDCGADIVGVRGAACETGRTSRVVAEKVRLLRAAALLTTA